MPVPFMRTYICDLTRVIPINPRTVDLFVYIFKLYSFAVYTHYYIFYYFILYCIGTSRRHNPEMHRY